MKLLDLVLKMKSDYLYILAFIAGTYLGTAHYHSRETHTSFISALDEKKVMKDTAELIGTAGAVYLSLEGILALTRRSSKNDSFKD